ncbi:hypothetical protein LguiA_021087 [Lonicera macranthoides]
MDDVDGSLSVDREEQSSTSDHKRGGWITFPFILATVGGLTIAGGGWTSNLIVYLIEGFNVKRIDAAQIFNVINGSSSFIPIIGAIIADSFLGCFSVVFISSFISLLGLILITLTATLDILRPQPCQNVQTDTCQTPSKPQLAIFYISIALACIGQGGVRFTLATMGANQFQKPKEQAIFFNWFFFSLYTASVIASTAIVYVEDNVGWGWGFGISAGANVIALVIFLIGSRFYRYIGPQGSPFMSIARVVVATVRKRRLAVVAESGDYWCGDDGERRKVVNSTTSPTKSFRFLNRAALKTEDATNPDGSIAKPWKLCTVQQVEDFKTLIRIFPLWSSSIFLGTPIAIQASLVVLQALTMDRHLGNHFNVPAGSILVFVLISTSLFLTIFDKVLWPAWSKIIGRPPTPLQRIGVGHVLNVLSMAISALVESKRLHMAHDGDVPKDSVVPMSVMWLTPQLALVGIGEAFHFPGQVALYYQEFPIALKNVSTAIISLLIAVAFYLSTAVIDLLRSLTGWLPNDINEGRIDNVYWVCVAFGVMNFGYYLVCALLYKYQNVDKTGEDSSSSS